MLHGVCLPPTTTTTTHHDTILATHMAPLAKGAGDRRPPRSIPPTCQDPPREANVGRRPLSPTKAQWQHQQQLALPRIPAELWRLVFLRVSLADLYSVARAFRTDPVARSVAVDAIDGHISRQTLLAFDLYEAIVRDDARAVHRALNKGASLDGPIPVRHIATSLPHHAATVHSPMASHGHPRSHRSAECAPVQLLATAAPIEIAVHAGAVAALAALVRRGASCTPSATALAGVAIDRARCTVEVMYQAGYYPCHRSAPHCVARRNYLTRDVLMLLLGVIRRKGNDGVHHGPIGEFTRMSNLMHAYARTDASAGAVADTRLGRDGAPLVWNSPLTHLRLRFAALAADVGHQTRVDLVSEWKECCAVLLTAGYSPHGPCVAAWPYDQMVPVADPRARDRVGFRRCTVSGACSLSGGDLTEAQLATTQRFTPSATALGAAAYLVMAENDEPNMGGDTYATTLLIRAVYDAYGMPADAGLRWRPDGLHLGLPITAPPAVGPGDAHADRHKRPRIARRTTRVLDCLVAPFALRRTAASRETRLSRRHRRRRRRSHHHRHHLDDHSNSGDESDTAEDAGECLLAGREAVGHTWFREAHDLFRALFDMEAGVPKVAAIADRGVVRADEPLRVFSLASECTGVGLRKHMRFSERVRLDDSWTALQLAAALNNGGALAAMLDAKGDRATGALGRPRRCAMRPSPGMLVELALRSYVTSDGCQPVRTPHDGGNEDDDDDDDSYGNIDAPSPSALEVMLARTRCDALGRLRDGRPDAPAVPDAALHVPPRIVLAEMLLNGVRPGHECDRVCEAVRMLRAAGHGVDHRGHGIPSSICLAEVESLMRLAVGGHLEMVCQNDGDLLCSRVAAMVRNGPEPAITQHGDVDPRSVLALAAKLSVRDVMAIALRRCPHDNPSMGYIMRYLLECVPPQG